MGVGALYITLFAALALAAIGGVLFATRRRAPDPVAKLALEAHSAVLIAEAPEGEVVKIAGMLVLDGDVSLEGPLSGRVCAAYVVRIERARTGRDESIGDWITIIKDQDATDFIVEDATGRALVRTLGAQMFVVGDEHKTSGPFEQAGPRLDAYLSHHGRSNVGALGFGKQMRYEEGVLAPGEQVAVIGRARWEADPVTLGSPGYRGGAKRLVIEMPSDLEMFISDEPSTLL